MFLLRYPRDRFDAKGLSTQSFEMGLLCLCAGATTNTAAVKFCDSSADEY